MASNSDFFARIRTVTIKGVARISALGRVNGSRKTTVELWSAAPCARRYGGLWKQSPASEHEYEQLRGGAEHHHAESGDAERGAIVHGHGDAHRAGAYRRVRCDASHVEQFRDAADEQCDAGHVGDGPL